jgi:stage V sporulation protein AB
MGFSAGLIISGAVFAFITVLGMVPRMAQKTKTTAHVKLYESAIVTGGLFGASTDLINYRLAAGTSGLVLRAAAVFYSALIGIFYGCLAVSLAEVLNVIPILTRRARLQQTRPPAQYMFLFVLAIALGKLVGSCLYHIVPGFFSNLGG